MGFVGSTFSLNIVMYGLHRGRMTVHRAGMVVVVVAAIFTRYLSWSALNQVISNCFAVDSLCIALNWNKIMSNTASCVATSHNSIASTQKFKIQQINRWQFANMNFVQKLYTYTQDLAEWYRHFPLRMPSSYKREIICRTFSLWSLSWTSVHLYITIINKANNFRSSFRFVNSPSTNPTIPLLSYRQIV